MSKKLVTKDESIIKKVENALCGIPYATFKASDGNIVLAVTNKNGDALKKVLSEIKFSGKIGVLRGHPQYSVPQELMKDLAKRSYQYTIKQNDQNI